MKYEKILSNLTVNINCAVINIDINNIDLEWNLSEYGVGAILNSPLLDQGIAFQFTNDGDDILVYGEREYIPDYGANIISVYIVSGMDERTGDCTMCNYEVVYDFDNNVRNVLFVQGNKVVELSPEGEEEEDDTDELDVVDDDVIQMCPDEVLEYDGDSLDPKASSPLTYEEVVEYVHLIDSMVDIMHCGNVELEVDNELCQTQRIVITEADGNYSSSRIAVSDRYSTRDGSFDTRALNNVMATHL